MSFGMIGLMLQKLGIVALLLTAGFSMSCGTASAGSKRQSQTGVSESGYPGGQPTDKESPALGSSTEQKYSGEKESAAEAEAKPEPAK
jgi:hypothetical protein